MKNTISNICLTLTVCLALVVPAFAHQIAAWGNNDYGQCDTPSDNDFLAISAGLRHSLALKSDGSLMAWGYNNRGQCNVPAGNDFATIAGGGYHSLALKSDGSVIAWGWNKYGQCNVPSGNDFIAIAGGRYHSLALKSDGSLEAWGRNYNGQCNVPAGNDFVAIACGDSHSLAVKPDGSLIAWGHNIYGQCNVPLGNDFVAIAGGDHLSLALKSYGTLAAWGDCFGGLCDVPTGNDFTTIAAGINHNLVLKSDGSLVAWGYNNEGRYNAPRGNDFIAIACGGYHNLALVSEPDTLVEIQILGPENVRENSQAQYKVVAYYDDGQTRNITDWAIWGVTPDSIATIENGLLRTQDINEPQDITIYAQYTKNDFTVQAEMTANLVFYEPYTFYIPTPVCETIQAAIDVAINGDTIIVADGTYTGPGNRDIDFHGKAITVRSENGPENCIINCEGRIADRHRGFYFYNNEDANSILAGFTIINGYAWSGGGILCDDGSSPTITNCNIIANTADGDGGGGGIFCHRNSNPTMTNCTFTGNSANRHSGGGISCWRDSNPVISNCTISGNKADYRSSGIYCQYNSSPTITNCILWGNTAPSGAQIAGSATVTYSDVEGGWAGDDNGGWPGEGNGGWAGEGNIDADPCFVQPGYWDMDDVWVEGDYHLLADSPCIDAGDNNSVPADIRDLDGNPRIVDGNDDGIAVVDMGAYEAMVSCFGVNHVKLKTKADKKGNEVELKGTFSPALPIDLAVDDVTYIIDDGQGNALVFLIPAGSFEVDGKPDKQKFKFHSAKGSQPDINAKFDFDKCKFELKVKKVPNTDEITSTTLTIELWAGANLVEEVVEVQVKPKHTEYKREPKLSCCPKCMGIALLEVTSTDPFTGDEYVLLFEPEPGKEKLKRKTVVDDGANGRVKIDTSCSKPLEVGDVFGVYTVTDLIKIFDDLPDGDT